MFNQYQNEIIAAVAILIVLIVFIIIKFKSKQILTIDDESSQAPTQTEEIVVTKEEADLIGTEEGEFGEEEHQNTATVQALKTKTIKRRDVPAHGKITKNHFSEFSGQRIIVAEDNLINQKVLTGLLAGSGIEVIIANHGQEVLDILETDNDFLMILMDAHMPIIDGFEATREIRKIKKYDHILVVALSGDTASDDIKKMSDAGMAEQLEKPLKMETLYNIFYAYTGKDNASEYVEVIMTKELNGAKGLEVCGGDEEFYREILSEFVQAYENSTQVLGQLLENNELQKADKLLLDIIGITANIGAEQLHAISITIKDSLSNKEERSYITLADEYKIHLENLIKDIKEYM
ncbi:MAG TPA: response regulator [Sulfurimonas sp.]|nr:response regulator [Sulfurimonas sp.]HIM75706.1 response regulator [Campylobacterales bacterium]